MIAHGDKCYDLELNTANVFDWTESKSRCDEFGIKLISVLDEDEDEWLNGKIFETGLFNGGDGSISGMWLGYQGERECCKSSNVWVFCSTDQSMLA